VGLVKDSLGDLDRGLISVSSLVEIRLTPILLGVSSGHTVSSVMQLFGCSCVLCCHDERVCLRVCVWMCVCRIIEFAC